MNSSSIFSQKKYTIVIDAGHGGRDPGNLGNGYKEKNIALKVALAVGKKLSAEKIFGLLCFPPKIVSAKKKSVQKCSVEIIFGRICFG